MTVRKVNNLPAAAHGETVRCLFAIELSKQSWLIGFTTPLSAKISRRILSGGDWKGLLELIEEVRARVSREIGRPVEVMSCYEAGYDGFWLHRQLEAHGVRNYVIDPASLQVDRRMRRAKTDRKCDALCSAQLLQARHRLRVQRMVIVDALERAKPFDAVDVLNTFRDQTVSLTVQPTRVLCSNARHLHHAPHFRFAAQIRHQRA